MTDTDLLQTPDAAQRGSAATQYSLHPTEHLSEHWHITQDKLNLPKRVCLPSVAKRIPLAPV